MFNRIEFVLSRSLIELMPLRLVFAVLLILLLEWRLRYYIRLSLIPPKVGGLGRQIQQTQLSSPQGWGVRGAIMRKSEILN
ncbi:MAG TPA: hypothetical protein DC064_02585 [Cyanobacteria bacterium UBA9273]|nr:hypothetical protein [Cyanobacteria bacterium UBA9273]